MRLPTITLLLVAGSAACSNPTVGTEPSQLLQPQTCVVPELPAASQLVSIDLNRQYQTIEGFGATERVFDDPHVTETFNAQTARGGVVVPAAEQAKILAALYTELGLTRVRYNPRDPSPGKVSGLEPQNDNDNPNLTELSKFDFSWKNNDAHIAYVKAAQPYGLKVFFASPLTLESWMSESNPEEYVEWAMAILRRWREQGVEMPYYSIVNEPGYSGSGIWSAQWLLATTKLLGAKLKSEGFATKLVIPDDINPVEAYKRASVVLADASARQYVGAIAYHLYGDRSNRDKLKELSEQYSIPIWMTEYALAKPFEWADIIHEEIAEFGASALDIQWGFFGQWEDANAYLIRLLYDGNNYRGWEPTKSYYTMGQYSKFVRPGARRVDVSGANGLKVTAFKQGDQSVVVAIAPEGGAAKRVTFDLAGGLCLARVTGVRTSASENWAPLAESQTAGRRFDATLAPGSITTFVVK